MEIYTPFYHTIKNRTENWSSDNRLRQ